MIFFMIKRLRYTPKICCRLPLLLPLQVTSVYNLMCLLPTSFMIVQKYLTKQTHKDRDFAINLFFLLRWDHTPQCLCSLLLSLNSK